MFDKNLIGMKSDAAEAVVKEAGMSVRIRSVDGEEHMLSADVDDKRINLDIKEGVVTGYSVG